MLRLRFLMYAWWGKLYAEKNVPVLLPSPPPDLRQARSLELQAAPSPSFTFPLVSSSTSPFSPSFFWPSSPSPLSAEASGCEQDAFLAAALGTTWTERLAEPRLTCEVKDRDVSLSSGND